MSLEAGTGSIFDADTVALVNPVNCDGVAGRGLAQAFKHLYPESYMSYVRMCNYKRLAPGMVFVTYASGVIDGPRSMLVYFPTKDKWRAPSQLDYVTTGLFALTRALRVYGIPSVAIPALGCGLGGLDWDVVRPFIERHMTTFAPDVRVVLYPPLEVHDGP